MGKGGGGGQQTSTSTSTPPSYLMPYIGQYLNLLRFLTSGKGHPPIAGDPVPNMQVAGLDPAEMQGLEQLLGASQQQTALGQAGAGTAEEILSGKFLDPSTNPNLKAYYNAAAQPMVANYEAAVAPSQMSSAALSGAFGGSSDAEARALGQYSLGNNLGNLAANIYEPAYQQGLQQMTQTLGMNPATIGALSAGGTTALGVGGVEQQQQQAELNAAYQNAYQKGMWPYELANFFGGGLGNAGMGYGTQRTTSTGPGSSLGQDIFGGALGIGGLAQLLFPGALSSGASAVGSSLSSILPWLMSL